MQRLFIFFIILITAHWSVIPSSEKKAVRKKTVHTKSQIRKQRRKFEASLRALAEYQDSGIKAKDEKIINKLLDAAFPTIKLTASEKITC